MKGRKKKKNEMLF